jgi:AraC family L-rhamnose operon regulatory protein RhaS
MNPPSRPAIFLAPGATYHADRCEPLVQAVERGEVELHAWTHRGYPGTAMPNKLLPEISTVGYWNVSGTPTWGLDWHRNEGIELTFLSRGRTPFLVEGESFSLESAHLTVTRPWQKHRVGNPCVGSTRLHWLILDVGVRRPDQPWNWPAWVVLSPADVRHLTTLLSHNEQPVWRANDDVAACFERMATLVRTTDAAPGSSRMRLCVNELLVALLELLSSRNPPLNPRLVSTRRSVEMFLAALDDTVDHPWTLEEMAERCGLGRSRFATYCREITNMTPGTYLSQRRVAAAQRLLRQEGDLSVTEIALRCGFQSSQYFAVVFRKLAGVAPREFRDARSGKGT